LVAVARFDVIVVVVAALFTVWATPVEVLAAKLASVTKLAVTVLAPAVVEANEQLPAVIVPEQVAVPSLTVTVSAPGIVPAPGAVTATVNATV
jgi:hypothetical protein